MAKKKPTEEEIEEKGGVVCDNFETCGNRAEYNLQTGGYNLYEVGEDGDYELLKEWGEGEEENSHYCEPCAKKEEII